MVMMASNPMTTNSKVRCPRRLWIVRMTIDTHPVISPPRKSGMLKSRLSAMAPPMTSATSVAIAIISAWSQKARRLFLRRR